MWKSSPKGSKVTSGKKAVECQSRLEILKDSSDLDIWDESL